MQIAWGVTCSLFSLVHSYAGLVIVRFFLGVAEAGSAPGIIYWSKFSTQILTLISSSSVSFDHSWLVVSAPNAGSTLCITVLCCSGGSYYFRLVEMINFPIEQLAGTFGGLVATAIHSLDGRYGIPGWK
jgi:hypothetical protein